MIIVPFEPEHALQIELQSQHAHWLGRFTPEYLAYLTNGPAFTGIIEDRIIASAGIVETGFSTGLLWALIAQEAGPHFVRLHRAGCRLIDLIPLRRLEATSERAFIPGCRWLELLGFECEGLMKKYGPDGSDHFRYARTV